MEVERYGSAVWIITVIVAIASIALVVYILLLASQVEPGQEPTELSLATPEARTKFIGGEDYWDITSEIKKIKTDEEKVLWVEVRVSMVSDSGRLLLPDTRVKQDAPSEYDDGSDGWVDVQAWYICTPVHESRVLASHTIKVTGITEDYAGGTLIVSKAGDVIGTVTIPPLTV